MQERELELLYKKSFPGVARLVRAMGGDMDDAKDLFHDALIIYMEREGRVELKVSPEAYVKGIVRILCVRKFREERGMERLDEMVDERVIPVDFYTPADSGTVQLMRHLKTVGESCMRLLRAFYYDGWSVGKIAETFRYGSEHSVSVQKYKCLEKLRRELKKSDIYESTAA